MSSLASFHLLPLKSLASLLDAASDPTGSRDVLDDSGRSQSPFEYSGDAFLWLDMLLSEQHGFGLFGLGTEPHSSRLSELRESVVVVFDAEGAARACARLKEATLTGADAEAFLRSEFGDEAPSLVTPLLAARIQAIDWLESVGAKKLGVLELG
jgi:hypothetical protein